MSENTNQGVLNDNYYLSWLSNIHKVGPFTVTKLIEKYGSAKNVYELINENIKKIPKVKSNLIKIISNSKDKLDETIQFYNRQKEIAEKCNAKIISINERDYPENLGQSKNESEKWSFLYIKGNLSKLKPDSIAIVGTRNASEKGKKIAFELGKIFANNNWSVVSGLALGIDAEAHKGAISVDKPTFSVLGCSVENIYPLQNKSLYYEIMEKGCIISQFPFYTKPAPDNLKKRNRLMGALVRAVIVVEASLESGTFNIVKFMLEKNKPLFVVDPKLVDNNSGNIKLVACNEAVKISSGNSFDEIQKNINNWEQIKSISYTKKCPDQSINDDEILKTIEEIKELNYTEKISNNGSNLSTNYLEKMCKLLYDCNYGGMKILLKDKIKKILTNLFNYKKSNIISVSEKKKLFNDIGKLLLHIKTDRTEKILINKYEPRT